MAARDLSSWLPGLLGPVDFQVGGVPQDEVPRRGVINLIGPITVADNPEADRTDVTFTAGLATDLNITGQAQGSTLYFNGTNWVRLLAGTSGQFLKTQGAGADPIWATQSTVATDLIIGSQAQGDVLYYNGTNWVRLPAGTSGQFLKTNGVGANPAWASQSTIATDLSLASQGHGDLTYFNGTNWVRLAPGTAGTLLQTNGVGASPTWVTYTPSDLNIASQAHGDILYFNGTNWVRLAAGTDGLFLKTKGVGFAPQWSAPTASDLSIASQAQGDVLYYNGTNWVRLPAGTSGQFLKTNGAAANPSWDSQSTVATDLSITGQAQGDVLYFNGTNWVRLPAGTSGQFLKTNGAAANPAWATASTSAPAPIETATSITLTTSNYLVTVTANSQTISLPASPTNGDTYVVKATSSTGTTVSGNGKNIDGASTDTLSQYESGTYTYTSGSNIWVRI